MPDIKELIDSLPKQPPDPDFEMRHLSSTGVLWAINAHLFHPRGFALVLGMDERGEPTGWSIIGDGTEPITVADTPRITERFQAFEDMLDSYRAEG